MPAHSMSEHLPPLVVLHYPTRVHLGRPSFELALAARGDQPVRAYFDVYLCLWRPALPPDGDARAQASDVREVILSREPASR